MRRFWDIVAIVIGAIAGSTGNSLDYCKIWVMIKKLLYYSPYIPVIGWVMPFLLDDCCIYEPNVKNFVAPVVVQMVSLPVATIFTLNYIFK